MLHVEKNDTHANINYTRAYLNHLDSINWWFELSDSNRYQCRARLRTCCWGNTCYPIWRKPSVWTNSSCTRCNWA